jgi:fibronectin-binding autotransporter adhesin
MDSAIYSYTPTSNGYSINNVNKANIAKVSDFEHWELSRAGTTRADVTLTYNTGSYSTSGIGNTANLRVVHWGPTQWDLPSGGGVSSQTGNNVAGTVKITNVTSFSPFTLGSLDGSSPLPVTWMYFNGDYVNEEVLLSWKTATELVNDHFEVERSMNGYDFTTIGRVAGKGNSSSPQFYQFTDKHISESKYYYRLRQVDFDGVADFSKTIMVDTGDGNEQRWTAFPNPVGKDGKLQLSQAILESEKPVNVTVTSSGGQILFNIKGMLPQVNARLENVIANMVPGAYMLSVAEGEYHQQFNIIRQ